MPVAAIIHEKREEIAHAREVCAVGNRTAFAEAFHEAAPRENRDVRGKGVVWAPDGFSNGPGRKPFRLLAYQQTKYLQPGRLTKRSQGGKGAPHRHRFVIAAGSGVADHRQ